MLISTLIQQVGPAVLAYITGVLVATNRLNGRITEISNRIFQVELATANTYITKSDVDSIIKRIEVHLVRVEDKLDTLAHSPCPRHMNNEQV